MGDPPMQSKWIRWRRRLLRVGAFLSVAYLVVGIVMLLLENYLVYHPTRAASWWAEPKELQAVDQRFVLHDGTSIHAWWCPQPNAEGALLYCHGNGGNVSLRAETYANLQREQNLSILAIDYPGYGHSEGSPTEANCCESAEVAYAWLTTEMGVPPDRIILFGESLGGGVVVELATKQPCRAIVLMSTFTSVPDVAKEMLPFFPTRLLMRNRFENLRKLPSIDRPIFFSHGDADTLIGIKHSRKLLSAARGPAELFVEQGREHSFEPSAEFHAALRQFLRQQAPEKQTIIR